MAEAPDADRSLRLAREVFSPSEQQRERVRSALAVRAASSSAASTPAASTPATPVRALVPAPGRVRGRVAAVLKPALLVGMGFVLGYWFAESKHTEAVAEGVVAAASPRAPEKPASEAEAPAPAASPGEPAPTARGVPTAPSASTATPAPSSALSAPESVSDHPVSRPRARTTRDPQRARLGSRAAGGLAEEVTLLQRAERALRSGNAALARSFIVELEARFPKTALRQERAALLVLAACVAHEPDAERGASEFIARHERSVYVDRIRSLCVLGPSSRSPATPAPSLATPEAGDGSLPRGH